MMVTVHPEGETVRRLMSVHRLSYEAFKGPIPEGMHIDHLCRVRNCYNPEHLEAVTQAENNRRMGLVITHCKRGHEYTEENTIHRKGNNGRRACRTCVIAKAKERRRTNYGR